MLLRGWIVGIIFLFLMPATVWAADPPALTAKAAIVIEASTGKVLYAKNAEDQHYPASTTKIMTLIVALEHGNLDDIVTASPNAAATEGSSLSLLPGEQMKLQDLLYGIMLISGNDATVAVAEHIAGSVPNFAKLMTEKAHMIGATHTNFTNSSGLPDPDHYTTAHDLARIAAYGYRNPVFAEIVGTKHKVLPGKDRDLYNENRMLWLYDGGNGVKTGYTEAAGRCLVSGANRNGVQLITVVLDSEHMWDDSIALMDYGFSQIKPEQVFTQGDILKTVRVNNGKTDSVRLLAGANLVLPFSDEDKDDFSTVIDAPSNVDAPVTAGQKLGKIKIMYKNAEIASVDLVAADNVDRKSFFNLLWGSVWGVLAFFIRNFA